MQIKEGSLGTRLITIPIKAHHKTNTLYQQETELVRRLTGISNREFLLTCTDPWSEWLFAVSNKEIPVSSNHAFVRKCFQISHAARQQQKVWFYACAEIPPSLSMTFLSAHMILISPTVSADFVAATIVVSKGRQSQKSF